MFANSRFQDIMLKRAEICTYINTMRFMYIGPRKT